MKLIVLNVFIISDDFYKKPKYVKNIFSNLRHVSSKMPFNLILKNYSAKQMVQNSLEK